MTPFAPAPLAGRADVAEAPPPQAEAHPLGIARGQIAKTDIVAEAEDGPVIVEQTGEHERRVRETLKHDKAGQQGHSEELLRTQVALTGEPPPKQTKTEEKG